MTNHQIDHKLAQLAATLALALGELHEAQAALKAAREREEALLEAEYQLACQEAALGYQMLEALGNEDLQEADYSEKYLCHAVAGGAA